MEDNEITYTVTRTNLVPAELLRDLNTQDREWAIVRRSALSEKVWGFHISENSAKAAARRWRSRDVVTR